MRRSGITWDEKTLDKWIKKPNALIPNNNMGTLFSGLPDAKERAKIIAFLKQDTNPARLVSQSKRAPHLQSDFILRSGQPYRVVSDLSFECEGRSLPARADPQLVHHKKCFGSPERSCLTRCS